MTLALYAHPFSSYCWKVLAMLWENGTPFDYRNLADPAAAAEFAALAPFGRMPLLVDGDRVVPEATIIVEHLDRHHPGPTPMIPVDPDAALGVRMLDRLADNYLMAPMQAIVGDALRREGERSAAVVAQAHATLDRAYAWWDAHMAGQAAAGRDWAAAGFGLADLAAGPALFYDDWVHPIPAAHAALRAYRDRLLARPCLARAVEEARPYRAGFPLGAPDRD